MLLFNLPGNLEHLWLAAGVLPDFRVLPSLEDAPYLANHLGVLGRYQNGRLASAAFLGTVTLHSLLPPMPEINSLARCRKGPTLTRCACFARSFFILVAFKRQGRSKKYGVMVTGHQLLSAASQAAVSFTRQSYHITEDVSIEFLKNVAKKRQLCYTVSEDIERSDVRWL